MSPDTDRLSVAHASTNYGDGIWPVFSERPETLGPDTPDTACPSVRRRIYAGHSGHSPNGDHPDDPIRTLGHSTEGMAEMATTKTVAPTKCPGCGGALLPGRKFCRPSCRARAEDRRRRQLALPLEPPEALTICPGRVGSDAPHT